MKRSSLPHLSVPSTTRARAPRRRLSLFSRVLADSDSDSDNLGHDALRRQPFVHQPGPQSDKKPMRLPPVSAEDDCVEHASLESMSTLHMSTDDYAVGKSTSFASMSSTLLEAQIENLESHQFVGQQPQADQEDERHKLGHLIDKVNRPRPLCLDGGDRPLPLSPSQSPMESRSSSRRPTLVLPTPLSARNLTANRRLTTLSPQPVQYAGPSPRMPGTGDAASRSCIRSQSRSMTAGFSSARDHDHEAGPRAQMPGSGDAPPRVGSLVFANSPRAGDEGIEPMRRTTRRRSRLASLSGAEWQDPTADGMNSPTSSVSMQDHEHMWVHQAAAARRSSSKQMLTPRDTGARGTVSPSPSSRVQEVFLRKNFTFDRLGADIVRHEQRGWRIQSLEGDGMLGRWNSSNPTASVRPGDFIVAVNGVRGDTNAMLVELQSMVVKISIERPKASRGHERRWTSDAFGLATNAAPEDDGGSIASVPSDEEEEEEEEAPTSIARLAEALVKHFGSLGRAHSTIDYNNAQEFSVGQWTTGLINAHINCQELCALKPSKVFRMMAAHNATDKFHVGKEAWAKFWDEHFTDTEHQELLKVDLGENGGRQSVGLTRGFRRPRTMRAIARLISLRHAHATGSEAEAEGAGEREEGEGGGEPGGERAEAEEEEEEEEEEACGAAEGQGRHEGGVAEYPSEDEAEVGHEAEAEEDAGSGAEGAGGRDGDEREDAGEAPEGEGQHEGGAAEEGADDGVEGESRGSTGEAAEDEAGKAQEAGQPQPQALDGPAADGLASLQDGEAATDASSSSSSDSEEEEEEEEDEGSEAALRRAELRAALEQARMSGGGPADGSAAVRRLLAGEGTQADVEGLGSKERGMLEDQQVIQHEIRELALEGIEAVAYVLMAKLGSYKRKAFRYFDVANQKCFPMMAWDLGMVMLRINMVEVAGLPATRVFAQMNTNGDSSVSWKEWKAFFKDVRLDLEDRHVAMGRVKARGVEQKRRKKRRKPRENNEIWQRLFEELSILEDGGCKDFAGMTETELRVAEAVCQKLGFTIHKNNDGSISVYNHRKFMNETRRKLRALREEHYYEFPADLTDVQRGIVHHVAEELGLASYDQGSGEDKHAVAANNKGFLQRIKKELAAIEPGGSELYTESFSVCQRHILNAVADSLELWVHSTSDGLEVFNLDDFAKNLRKDLQSLADGDEITLQPGLTDQQRVMVFAIAEDLELCAVDIGKPESGQIAVGNMRTFMNDVWAKLKLLRRGCMESFDKGFTPVKNKAVIDVATQMGLYSETMKTNFGTWVEVHRLYPGQKAPYRLPPPIQFAAVAEADGADGAASADSPIAAEASAARRRGALARGKRSSTVASFSEDPSGWFREVGIEKPSAPRTEGGNGTTEDDDHLSEGEEEAENPMKSLFDTFATGEFQGQRIFTRFLDLKKLATSCKANGTEDGMFQNFKTELETVFNDTVQLQIDMELRTNKGLTFRWFQVFMQTSMRKLGKGSFAFLLKFASQKDADT
ncbi:unnamed protein product [Prorocentrum cordatum]|uniref:Uncharacterized protein n=1 Tax=Prorocentrum cordatum TaxID=2364126 RepID=A0ABN9PG64_9DINO|nr:unnamed protein product [Polarella glacialis]